MTRAVRAALFLLLAAGCMEGSKPNPLPRATDKEKTTAGTTTLYQRLGGKAGVKKIVDDFCAEVMASDAIREVHKEHFMKGGEELKQKLRDQFGEEAGGPEKYTGKNMKDAHKGMGITEADFAALVAALVKALNKNDVSKEDQNAFLGKLARYKDDVIEPTGERKGVTKKGD